MAGEEAGSLHTPLHTLDPTGRFSSRAGDYAKYRPTYPAAAIDAALEGLGDPASLTAADVGAGTGISAHLLADRGVTVIAVEPNAAMRDAAAPHERIRWSGAAAESTGLAPASVDLVLCAQAFHWFRPVEALAEFRRILRPGGRLALIWNLRDDNDPFTAEYGRLLDRVSSVDWSRKWTDYAAVLRESTLFENVRTRIVPHEQRLDADALIGRAMSASYVPKSGPECEWLQRSLREAHTRHAGAGGLAALRYGTHIFLAESPAPGEPR